MVLQKNHHIHSSVGSIFIHVGNMERAINWYSKLLGVKLSYNQFDKIKPIRLNNILLILDAHRAENLQPSDQPLFSFSTNNIDEAYKFLNEIKVEMIGNIEKFTDVAFITIKDSEGNTLMVVQEMNNR